jgi:hypothetical protein
MTELEWLKQESGLSDEDLKAWETTLGDAKFKTFLGKIMKANESSGAARAEAERQLQQFTQRYTNEFLPAMRTVTQESIAREGEVAALKAKLAKAVEYGVVPEDEVKPEAPRAPGSPDPNAITRESFDQFSRSQSNTILALQDLNAEHFSLFGAPLGNTQELVAEVERQRLLGNKNFSLKNAWEQKHNVPAKRAEVEAAKQEKRDAELKAKWLKEERERTGANPNTRRGQSSQHSRYKPADGVDKKPWQSSRSKHERNAGWREHAREAVAKAAAA